MKLKSKSTLLENIITDLDEQLAAIPTHDFDGTPIEDSLHLDMLIDGVANISFSEDNGFRKTAILNKAIALAEGHYIIQADGDCILHRNFVKDHVSSAIPGLYLYGSRVNIKEQHLSYLFKKKQVHFKVFSKGIKKRTRALHIGLLSKLYKPSTVFSKKYRGCNTSFYKSDFIAVNGYDEDIKGWGREDSELALRLHNYGLKGKRLRYKGIVFHIFHKEKPKDRLELNNKIEEQTKRLERIKCKTGVTKYL